MKNVSAVVEQYIRRIHEECRRRKITAEELFATENPDRGVGAERKRLQFLAGLTALKKSWAEASDEERRAVIHWTLLDSDSGVQAEAFIAGYLASQARKVRVVADLNEALVGGRVKLDRGAS